MNINSAEVPELPLSSQVEEQLARILQSGELHLPRRGASFLSFVVEETLAGRGAYLKAFTIATGVFGRDCGFDPQSDPCVRIQAGKVRTALERYYLVRGMYDPIEITIPKGGYRPTFAVRLGRGDPQLNLTSADTVTSWPEKTMPEAAAVERPGRRTEADVPWVVLPLVIALAAFGASLKSVSWASPA